MERASRILGTGLSMVAAALVGAGIAAQAPAEREPAMSAFLADSLAPLLAMLIAAERDAARAQGVEPIPPPIRAKLVGYVPEHVLDRVRWREGAAELSLPQNVIRFGHATAMTLDDVVVFQDRHSALEDPKLWAHELKHVMQFAEWGVAGFAARYLRDYEDIEMEAAEFRWQFMKQAGLVPPVPGVE